MNTFKNACCEEFVKFVDILDANGVNYVRVYSDHDEYSIARVHFEAKGRKWSVIHGFGTYGGWSSLEADKGLLEVLAMDSGDDPVGCLTAEQAWELVIR